jgi:transcriptional regulator NrdR family protein
MDSRPITGTVRRRRQCKVCGQRFTTHEVIADAEGLAMVRIDGLPDHVQAAIRILAA